MTEWMYGSQYHYEHFGQRRAIDMTDFGNPERRAEYAKEFPRVVARLNSYEAYASKMAAKLGVDMRLLFSGGEGIASFRLEARFGTKGMPTPDLLYAIDVNVAALRETYYELAERQRTLYFMWAELGDKA